MLLKEERFAFDTNGRNTHSSRLIYRILAPAALDSWSSVGAEWDPWRQERPTIRARVITADHQIQWMDPKTLDEVPAHNDTPEIFSDRRILRAPLPAEEVVTRERIPFFDQGTVHRVYFGSVGPVHRSRLVIEFPASLPLRYVTRLLPSLELRRSETGGIVRLVFDNGPMNQIEKTEPLLPADIPRQPYVAFSTGQSWQQVTARYSKMVDAQIRLDEVRRAVAGMLSANLVRQEIITKLLRQLHEEVRYTGVEFGEAALVPSRPEETLQRKYGDCKDQAALLISMLRAAGIPAYIALLSAYPGQDVEPDLPGMGAFDHAVVYVPGTPDLWIDPTDKSARAGELPNQDQGRLALIIRPETIGLIRTSEVASINNRVVEQREFLLSELGPARVIETSEVWGSIERGYRRAYGESEGQRVSMKPLWPYQSGR